MALPDRKTHFIGFRISEKEHNRIYDLANQKGKSISEYLRLLVTINILQNKKPELRTPAKLKCN